MAEHIERDKLLYEFREIMPDIGVNELADKLYNAALDLPAADVAEVKRGKWIEVQKENIWNDIVPVLECSACGKYTVGTRGIMTKSNYCPNCGAKMGAEG
ncbi:Uncharacterised protein [uncultured Ruminococcus sp.]|nr:Uncharacterised protein [uncultured Ruminococcus sp.]